MQPSPSSWRSALRAAFPHTVPILAGFLVLGALAALVQWLKDRSRKEEKEP